MYPPQTSLLPVTSALASFAESHGFFSWYPHWYLGNPFNYLTGPVMPSLLIILHKILPSLSLLAISQYLNILISLLSPLGWGLFAAKFSGKKTVGILTALFFTIFPLHNFLGLGFTEGSEVLAKALLPLILLSGLKSAQEGASLKARLLTSALFAFLLLTNVQIAGVAVVGLFLLGVVMRRQIEGALSSVAFPAIIGWILTLWWYPLSYWINLSGASSFGGKPLYDLVPQIFDLFRSAIPFALGLAVVFWKGRSHYERFSYSFFLAFLFLSLVRFVFDPDFWTDWSAWGGELEAGLALILSGVIGRVKATPQEEKESADELEDQGLAAGDTAHQTFNPTGFLINPSGFPFVVILLLGIFSSWIFILSFDIPWLPQRSIEDAVEKRVAGFLAENVAPDERVFLSGSTVFWLNAFPHPPSTIQYPTSISQVRGGSDQNSLHPFWARAAYAARESQDPELVEAWLRALGVSWVVVHGEESKEYYHDFKNLEVWEGKGLPPGYLGMLGYRAEDIGGDDQVYRLLGTSLAWVVDEQEISSISGFKEGKDLEFLDSYLSARKRPTDLSWDGPNEIEIRVDELQNDELITVLITFDRGWKASQGDQRLDIKSDPLGHLLFRPLDDTPILLEYRPRLIF